MKVLQSILDLIKKIVPDRVLKTLRPFYHGFLSLLGAYYYGRPSDKMVVIGITGTAGKSTTIAMLAKVLNQAGKKCGYITTVGFSDGEVEMVNWHGLSMPGRFLLQKQLSQILNAGCKYAIVEVTSEGLSQNRHLGVQFDLVALTNLGQAHLDAHKGFENYKKAKGKLFAYLNRTKRKSSFGKKISVVNLETKDSAYFTAMPADLKIGVIFDSAANSLLSDGPALGDVYMAESFAQQSTGSEFQLRGVDFKVRMPGKFNAQNALLAVACANNLGVDLKDCAEGLASFISVLGRMQEVPNEKGIKVIVDYAPEPVAMQSALIACTAMPHTRLIHVFGSTGGHRDVKKRYEFGQISARFSDVIVVTNDDVYDSDPEEIARNIKKGIDSAPKKKAREVNIILDRREALKKALSMARSHDLVLVTGKGSEQFLILPGNRRVAWDEVGVIKEELKKLSNLTAQEESELTA